MNTSWIFALLPLQAAELCYDVPETLVTLPPGSTSIQNFETADLNGDLVPDLVTVSGALARTALGNGDGTFAPFQTWSFGVSVDDVAVADVTGDGRADLVGVDSGVALVFDSLVVVLPGTGTGSFGTALSFDPGAMDAGALAVFDWNGDSLDDVVVSSEHFARVYVWLQDGLGGFTEGPEFLIGQGGLIAHDLEVGHLDADGVPDFVSVASNGAWARISSTGSFLPLPQTNALVRDVELFDVDGDGDLDAIGATFFGLFTWLNDGAGAFALPVQILPWTDLLSIEVGQVEGSPVPELAVYTGSQVLVLSGGVSGAELLRVVAVGAASTDDFGLADTDGDGHAELLFASDESTGPAVRIVPGGAAGPDAPEGYLVPSPPRVALVDFDGDGNLDVVSLFSQEILLRRGDGQGGFLGHELLPFALHGSPNRFTAFEANGDGLLDIGLFTGSYESFALLLQDGLGGLTTAQELDLVATGANQTGDLESVTCDWDRNGTVDVVHFGKQGKAVVLLSDGTGQVSELPAFATVAGGRRAAAGDLNGDGWLDLVSIAPTGLIGVTLGAGAAGALPTLPATDLGPTSNTTFVAVGDLDGNGLLDAAAVVSGELHVLLGDGAGGLSSTQTLALDGIAESLALADADLDGNLDALVSFGAPGRTDVFPGQGDGTLGTAEAFHTTAGDASWIDADADGRLDLVARYPGAVAVLRECTALAGLASFGSGTPGCVGALGLGASSAPAIGNADFAFVGTNAGPFADGWLVLGLGADPTGTDPLGLGALFHLSLLAPLIGPFPVKAGPSGEARFALPLPDDTTLVSATVHAQMVWLPSPVQPCLPPPLGLASSRGLTVTFLP